VGASLNEFFDPRQRTQTSSVPYENAPFLIDELM